MPVKSKPEINHHRQVLWQIWLPFVVCTLVFLAVCVLIVLSSVQPSSGLSRWTSMSTMWLIVLIAPPALLLLVLLAALIYVMMLLLRNLPPYAHLVQAYVAYFAALVRFWLDRLVKPVFAVQGFYARWQALSKRLFKLRMN